VARLGSNDLDMEMVKRETRWVVGTRVQEGGAGDPSPATARGLMGALRAVSEFIWDTDNLAGRTVAVMGVGKVGADLVQRLSRVGCECIVADTYPPAIEHITAQADVEVIDPEKIYDVPCDIFSPCSLGGTLNEETIPRLKCRAVVGAANNQLATDEDAARFEEHDILYAPDFVVNAGGLINVAEEIHGFEEERATAHIDKVYDNTRRVLEAAAEKQIPPQAAACQMVEERIRNVGSLRLRRRSGDDRN
jgi:leucine dehydrogenase